MIHTMMHGCKVVMMMMMMMMMMIKIMVHDKSIYMFLQKDEEPSLPFIHYPTFQTRHTQLPFGIPANILLKGPNTWAPSVESHE